MSTDDRTRWDRRHRERTTLTPRPSVLALAPPGRTGAIALDLACGQGRHTGALVRAGYRVVAMDVSGEALAHVAAAGPTDVLLVQGDVDAWPFAAEAFDLIVQVDFLDRRIFDDLRRSLRTGGVLLIDTFLDQGHPNAEGPSRAEFLLAPGELRERFADFAILADFETRGATGRSVFAGRKR